MFFAVVGAIVRDCNNFLVAKCAQKNAFYLFDDEVFMIVNGDDEAEYGSLIIVFFVQG
jgi:hypothetical protein